MYLCIRICPIPIRVSVSMLHPIVSWAVRTTFKLWSKLWAGGAVSVVECRCIEKTWLWKYHKWHAEHTEIFCFLNVPRMEETRLSKSYRWEAHRNLLLSRSWICQNLTDGRRNTQKSFAFSNTDSTIYCKHM